MRYYFVCIGMATVKHPLITSVDEDVEKLEPSYTWWECKMVQLLWKTVW